jgi:hypothetical protein
LTQIKFLLILINHRLMEYKIIRIINLIILISNVIGTFYYMYININISVIFSFIAVIIGVFIDSYINRQRNKKIQT